MLNIRFNRLLPLLGFRHPPRRYPYTVETLDLGAGESLQCARWLHPKASPLRTLLTPAAVADYLSLINLGDFRLDIGAHMGLHSTLPLAPAARGPGGGVLARTQSLCVIRCSMKNVRANRPT